MILSPKISIITVVFNAAEMLEETIKSVLAQMYDNWEFIIVDGGSTDGTIDILKRYQLPKILWKSEPDKGIYDAMNKGIIRASGEWIYFLGADDTFIDSNVLEKIFLNKSYEADFIYGNVFDKRLKRNYDGEFDQNKLLQKNICHQGIFFNKSLFITIGNYNTNYRLLSDWDFNLRCFSNAKVKKEYLDVVVANYSEGGASAENNDILFFREVLFPQRLQNIKKRGLKSLRNIRVYDEWWRLLRSLRLEKNEHLSDFSDKTSLPVVIRKMHTFQKKIPYSYLKVGIFSKSTMFISYSLHLMTKQIP
jgi:glycosyltransferase involved in cell wall biosynthesis